MKRLIAAALMFSLAGSSSPVFAKIECDRSICVNYSTAKWVHSKVPGAPSYKVKQFQGKRIFSNGNNPAVMEIDCRKLDILPSLKAWGFFTLQWVLLPK